MGSTPVITITAQTSGVSCTYSSASTTGFTATCSGNSTIGYIAVVAQ
jgi:hypothetical protein